MIQKLRELSDDDAIIATDVGQHQMWTAQFFGFNQPRTLLSSGGLGTMGFGLPAAMGAQAAFPERQVIAICGDGGFQMNIQETGDPGAEPAAGQDRHPQQQLPRHGAPVAGAVLRQALLLRPAWNCRSTSSSWPMPMEPRAFRPPSRARWRDHQEGFQGKGPVIMEFKIAREEKVLPMVPAGASLNEMVLERLELIVM